jgi:putative Holliday junction resolvase
MPNYLGIDYGTKRIGLAWADELLISLPVGAIPGADFEGCWDALLAEVQKRQITEIVIGYPVHMDGTKGKRAEEVDAFIENLQSRLDMPVHRVDERLTSLAARNSLGGKFSAKGADKSGKVDATAACLILSDFLTQ